MAKYRVTIDYVDSAITPEVQTECHTLDCNTINSLATAVNKCLESAKTHERWYLEVEKAIDEQWQLVDHNKVLYTFNLELTKSYKVWNVNGNVEFVASSIKECLDFIKDMELEGYIPYCTFERPKPFYPTYYTKYKGKKYDIEDILYSAWLPE